MDAEKLLQAFTPEETQEIAAVLPADVFEAEALRRGFELPLAAATIAVEATTQAEEAETTPEAPVSTPVTKESLAEKLSFAHTGYTELVSGINAGRKRNRIKIGTAERLEAEYNDWITPDRLDYINTQMEADPELSYTLVATPNETVTADELLAELEAFGSAQPFQTQIYSTILKKYTAQEVSGTNPGNGKKFLFKLVPSKLTPDMYGTVEHQTTKLAELQADTPFLDGTSPLEDATYLRTKRAVSGGVLSGKGTANETYMRSYKLDPKRFDDWLYVPGLYVLGDGELSVGVSYADVGSGGRVSVG